MPSKARKAPPAGLSRLRKTVSASAASADFAGTRLAPPPDEAAPPTDANPPNAAQLQAPAAPVDVSAPTVAPTEPVAEPAVEQPAPPVSPVAPDAEKPATGAGFPDSAAELTSPPRTDTAPDSQSGEPRPTAPSPAAVPARAPRPRTARKTSSTLKPDEAREAVITSYLSARRDPRSWVAAGVRLPVDLRDRLEERLLQDQEATGNYALALAHYVNAALDLIPDEDIDTSAAWASDYLASLGMTTPRTMGTGTRLHSDVALRMRRMPARLRRHSRYGLAGYLHAAAVAKLLDALDTADAEQGEPIQV
jgi:hypothetical protein